MATLGGRVKFTVNRFFDEVGYAKFEMSNYPEVDIGVAIIRFLILAILRGWTEITTNPRCTQKGVASNFHTVQDTELHKGLNERYFQGDQVSRRNF